MAKTESKIAEIILFIYLTLFPFGQIIRFEASFLGAKVPIHPVDIVVGLGLLFWISTKLKKPPVYDYFKSILWILSFSLLFSLSIFTTTQILLGLLYCLRLISYSALFFIIWNLVRARKELKNLFLNALILISTISAVFGWIQYLFYPDLRPLLFLGWDDHLFRMTGTFLDPGFLSIVLVFGSTLALVKYFEGAGKRYLFFFLFSAASIAFTYARAGYLAFIAAALVLGILKRKLITTSLLIVLFLLLIPALPRPSSEGVKLERLSSVYSRITSYSQTFEIIKKYPLFGVGFDNLCALRGKNPTESHSCAGAEASILTILATTGIVGLFYFINLGFGIIKSINLKTIYGTAFISCLISLGVHSLFVNSLFYPWVMGYMAILLGLSVND